MHTYSHLSLQFSKNMARRRKPIKFGTTFAAEFTVILLDQVDLKTCGKVHTFRFTFKAVINLLESSTESFRLRL